MRILLSCTAALVLTAIVEVAPAHADPCRAPVERFRPGDAFSGEVRYVGDGDSLCIGKTSDPRGWVEVRLADFNAPELSSPQGPYARSLLESLALGQFAQCVAASGRGGGVVSYDRVVAICRVSGRSLGSEMKAAGAPQGGR